MMIGLLVVIVIGIGVGIAIHSARSEFNNGYYKASQGRRQARSGSVEILDEVIKVTKERGAMAPVVKPEHIYLKDGSRIWLEISAIYKNGDVQLTEVHQICDKNDNWKTNMKGGTKVRVTMMAD